MENVPSFLALLGILFTLTVNLVLGLVKSKTENKTVGNSAEKEFRDDILEWNEHLQTAIKEKDIKIEALQKSNADLANENLTLSLTNKKLIDRLNSMQEQIDAFNRKVFYTSEGK